MFNDRFSSPCSFIVMLFQFFVIGQCFAELPSLSFIRCASLIGHNNSQEMRTGQMQDTIAKFRDGRVCPYSMLPILR